MCPACGDTLASMLGFMGSLVWYRCRSCGTDYNLADDGHDSDSPYWAERD